MQSEPSRWMPPLLLAAALGHGTAHAATTAHAQHAGSPLSLLPMLGLFFVLMYFTSIRPQKQQRARHRAMLNELKAQDDVLLTSGIFGTVQAINDDAITVRLAEGVDVRVKHAAISRLVNTAEPATSPTDASADNA